MYPCNRHEGMKCSYDVRPGALFSVSIDSETDHAIHSTAFSGALHLHSSLHLGSVTGHSRGSELATAAKAQMRAIAMVRHIMLYYEILNELQVLLAQFSLTLLLYPAAHTNFTERRRSLIKPDHGMTAN